MRRCQTMFRCGSGAGEFVCVVGLNGTGVTMLFKGSGAGAG